MSESEILTDSQHADKGTQSAAREGNLSQAAVEPSRSTPKTENGHARATTANISNGVSQLPEYARSLLKIKVPVIVTLATAKRSVTEILDIVPGAIIQFDKSCDEPLNLEVTNQSVAVGEAVKVGDKFGLRISKIVLPEERFHTVHKAATAGSKSQPSG